MRNASISIITPTLNQGSLIEKCIDSVLSQGIRDLEYIIVDGGSTDNTIEILKKYEKYLTWWVSEVDQGQSDAINKGYLRSSGQIINWINSDDYYEPNALKTISSFFDNPKTNVVCGRSRLFNSSGTIKYSRGTDVFPANLAKTIGWARFDQPETFFRRNAWHTIGSLNIDLHYLMDKEWWVRYLLNYQLKGIEHINDVLVNFRIHENSKTVKSNDKFQIDHDSIFFHLAKSIENERVALTIKKLFAVHNSYSLILNIDPFPLKRLINQSLQYYLFQRAHECYYLGLKKECDYLLQQIETDLIEKEDLKLLRSITFKNKFVPSFLSRLYRIIK